jgi:hypothetical protein
MSSGDDGPVWGWRARAVFWYLQVLALTVLAFLVANRYAVVAGLLVGVGSALLLFRQVNGLVTDRIAAERGAQ